MFLINLALFNTKKHIGHGHPESSESGDVFKNENDIWKYISKLP